MAFVPSGDVKFYSVPFNATNVLSKKFTGTAKHTVENVMCSKNTESGTFKVNEHADSLRDCNYISFKNTSSSYSSRTFYAFITAIEYISANCAKVCYMMDYYQSFFDEITYLPCWVEREHVNSDTVGEHILDEGFSSDYVVYSTNNVTQSYKYGIYEAPITEDKVHDCGGGIVSALYSFSFDSISGLNNYLKNIPQEKFDEVKGGFMFPSDLYDNGSKVIEVTRIASGDTINKYKPKNNKLYTYPYCCLALTNNNGCRKEYAYERFTSTRIYFEMKGDWFDTPNAILYPMNYNGRTKNYEEGVTFSYPTFSIATNDYDSYVAQNRTGQQLGVLSSFINGTVNGAMTGNVGVGLAHGVASSVASVLDTVKTNIAMQYAPHGIKGQSTDKLTIRTGQHVPVFEKCCFKSEILKEIDNYFTMFGYKVCSLKKPNVTGRPNWNYVKCINAIVKGNMPNEAKLEIEGMLNNGVTFWHSLDTFGDYSKNNTL